VHRDIKPGNIFLKAPSSPYDSFPQPVLADIDEVLELVGYMAYTRKCYLHTAGYAAPENNPQIQHDVPDDRGFGFSARIPLTSKSDIWSLGVVLWEMMHSFLGRRRDSPWNAAILNTISPNPDFLRLTTQTLP
jgi:serine/threonine protein kinase